MERYDSLIKKLNSLANKDNVAGMQRFGIKGGKMLGISVTVIRKLAGEYKRNHALALKLWESGIHEARIMASIIADPEQLDEKMMDKWTADFDSWDTVDQVCGNLYSRRPDLAYNKIGKWSRDNREFVRRAAFSLLCYLTVHDKTATDDKLAAYFPLIKKYSSDERNFVRKAVNWSLRQIGKRNKNLNKKAARLALELSKSADKNARWIGKDAYRELTDAKVRSRLD